MATFTPFMQGSEAQSVISDYIGGKLKTQHLMLIVQEIYRNPF